MILYVLGIQLRDFYLFSQHFILLSQLLDYLFLAWTGSSSFGLVLTAVSAGTCGLIAAAIVIVRLSREEAGLAVGL